MAQNIKTQAKKKVLTLKKRTVLVQKPIEASHNAITLPPTSLTLVF